MNASWQTPLALFVVFVAFALLTRNVWRKRAKPGCGSNCGCGTSELKAKLRK